MLLHRPQHITGCIVQSVQGEAAIL